MKNGKITLLVMAAGFVLCTAARVYSIVACTDMTTGFYYHDSALLCNILYYGLIVLTFAGAAVAAHFDKKGEFGRIEATDITKGRAAVIGFGTLILGLFALYEGLSETKQLTPAALLINSDFVFAGAAAVTAFIVLYLKGFRPFMGLIYAAGGIYFIMRGIYCFNNRMVIASVPEYLIEVLCTIGGAVSFVMIAKFLSGNAERFTKAALCGWCSATAVLTLSSGAAVMLADLIAPEEISRRITPSVYEAEMFFQTSYGNEAYMMVYSPWVNMVMGAFIAAVMIVIFFAKHTESADESNG